MKKRFLICVIFYNEKKNMIKTIKQLKSVKYDILYINDGSTDDNYNYLKKNKINKVINHKINLGYGAAVKTASKYAKRKGYKFFGIFPGDNQRKVTDLIKLYLLLEKFSKKFAFISGSKFHLLKNIPLHRKFGNVFFSILSKFWGNNTKDILSGFKVYNTALTYKIIQSAPDNYSFDLFVNLYSNMLKKKHFEINVNCNYKNQSSKMTNLFLIFIHMIKTVFFTLITKNAK